MQVAIIGAGAIGGYVGASLAQAGVDVTLVARGAHLQAMRERGLSIVSERGSFTVQPKLAERIADLGRLDVVILALKAHQIAPVAHELAQVMHEQTAIVTMQNGIPWWYFNNHGGPLEGRTLESVDPGGFLGKIIDPQRIVGCVIYSSTRITAPGCIEHIEGTRYSLGECDRQFRPRTERIAQALIAGGLKAPIEQDIRRDIWIKLLGNACFNPLSVLTRATLVDMANDALVEALVRRMMEECLAVARAVGIEVGVSIDKRIDGARRVGTHKTSMLQDLEAGRPFELDCVTGAIVELADMLGVEVPITRHVYGMAKLLEKTLSPPIALERLSRVYVRSA